MNTNSIPRRDFIKLSGVLGLGLAPWPRLAAAVEPTKKATLPNIIVYLSDDHGATFSEAYGNDEIHTPHLKQLAQEGTTFNQAFCASPCCGPSRTAMFTALWPARNGAEPNHMKPRLGLQGLPDILKDLGYETAAIGKVTHGGWEPMYNFDYYVGPRSGKKDLKDASDYLANRDSSKPLCLFFGAHFPHTPWVDNAAYDPDKLTLPPTLVDTPVMREEYAKYYSSVTATDSMLGDFRELVKKHVPGDPLFIYTSDHGAQLPFSKWDLYDAGIRVPFIGVWPGHLKPATTTDAAICLPDLLPTLIDIAGGQVPTGLDGESFAGVLNGEKTTHRDHIFATQSGDSDCNVYPSRSLRTSDWKYILNLHPEYQHHTFISLYEDDSSGQRYWKSWLEAAETDPAAAAIVKRHTIRPAEELYDLNADPHELNNLAAAPEHADRLASMRKQLKQWMAIQSDQETVFGNPLLVGEPAELLTTREVQDAIREQNDKRNNGLL